MAFHPATRQRVKARLAMIGLSKSGKSLTSLAMLRGIVGPDGRIAAIDTENGALSLYAGRFPGTHQPSGFDVQELTNCTPDSYIKLLNEAAAAKYDGLLLDSATQEWQSILELVDGQTDKFFGGWKVATPKHNSFIRAIVSSPLHIIVTVRQKDDYIIEQVNGKNTPVKVGMEPIQRKQFEYEFNAVMTMDLEHVLRVTHSAIDFLPNGTVVPPFEHMNDAIAFGADIKRWLDDGDVDWVPPVYRKAYYVNEKEIVSGGIEKTTYMALMNRGLALDKVTKRGNAKSIVAHTTNKSVLADLTEEEGSACLALLTNAVEEATSTETAA